MRVYLLTDLEGVAGVLDLENWCREHSRYRHQAGELVTAEANAAVEGLLAGGATEILVVDGHGGGGRGIIPSLLHPAAELACKAPSGAKGTYCRHLNSRPFDVAACVGQYPKAGTVGGHLCHTGGHGVRDLSINGISVGEFGRMVLCAGELGVRCIFASGCEALTKEAQVLVPGIETVAVKTGLQTAPGHSLPFAAYMHHNISAIHLSPEEARKRIRAGAQRAIERARTEDFGIVRIDPPFCSVEVWRSDDTHGPRVVRKSHPTSVIGLLNATGTPANLDADPLKLLPAE